MSNPTEAYPRACGEEILTHRLIDRTEDYARQCGETLIIGETLRACIP